MGSFMICLSDEKLVPVSISRNGMVVRNMSVKKKFECDEDFIPVKVVDNEHHLRLNGFRKDEVLISFSKEHTPAPIIVKEDSAVVSILFAFIRFIDVVGVKIDTLTNRIFERNMSESVENDVLTSLNDVIEIVNNMGMPTVRVCNHVPISITIDTGVLVISSFMADVLSLMVSAAIGKKYRFSNNNDGTWSLFAVTEKNTTRYERTYSGDASVFVTENGVVLLDDKRLMKVIRLLGDGNVDEIAKKIGISRETTRRRLETLRNMDILCKDAKYAGKYHMCASRILDCGPVTEAMSRYNVTIDSGDKSIMSAVSLILDEAVAIGFKLGDLASAIGYLTGEFFDRETAKLIISGGVPLNPIELTYDEKNNTAELYDWTSTTDIGNALYGNILANLIGKVNGKNMTYRVESPNGTSPYRFSFMESNEMLPLSTIPMLNLLV